MPEVKRILRSPREIRKMRAAGLLVWQAHQAAARILKPGVTTAQLNEQFKLTFAEHGATPLFLDYGGPIPFPAETCISINEEIVHGIPGERVVLEGDIVSLDTGCRLDGWCGDAAVTHAVGQVSPVARKLLDVTLGTLNLAIDLMQINTMWGEIAKKMEVYVKDARFSVVEEMVGHGIGRDLHEPPQVPNFYNEEILADDDFDLRPGVVLAIEPMVNEGVADLVELNDQWTLITADKKLSAHFEHTVAITENGPVRLTGPPDDDELATLPEWLHDRQSWVVW